MDSRKLGLANQAIVPKMWVADSFFSRLLGLMGRKTLPADEAVYFPRCNSIHTFFMRFAIDVVFVDANGKVIDVLKNLKPWRMPLPRFKAKQIIELRGGRASELGIAIGVTLEGVDS